MNKEMAPKVSIIVPIYNAHDLIGQCLDHLLAQTLKEIEVICVLDCPTDGTDKVVEAYAQKDDRIKVIHNKTNLHVGESRNVGLAAATGEYIGFSDHDDYCEPQMYETLYNIAKAGNLPFALCEHDCIVMPHGKTITYINRENKSTEHCLKGLLKSVFNCSAELIWDCIYRKDFLEANKLQFVDTRNISGEDFIFNTKVLLLLKKQHLGQGYTDQVFYHHLLHEESTGAGDAYLSKLPLFRNYLTNLVIEDGLDRTYLNDANIGNIAILYRLTRTWLRRKEYKKALRVLHLLKEQEALKTVMKQEFRLWDKELTLPKNLFKWICRLYI